MKLEKVDYLVALCLLVTLAINYGLTSTLKQIPSPVYGGDFYNGLGGVVHITDGGNPLESAQMVGELPWVPPLYHITIAILSKISGLNEMNALINFALLVQFASFIVVFFLLFEITQNKYSALIGTLLFVPLHAPIFKYSDFATVLMVPLFLLGLIRFTKNPDQKNMIFCSLTLGLLSLSNTQAFFVGFLVLGITFLFWILPKILKDKTLNTNLESNDIESLKRYAIVFVIAFLIALTFWYKPLFVYYGETPNEVQDFTRPDVREPAIFWKMFGNFVSWLLFPYNNGPIMVFSLLSLYGLYQVAKNRKENTFIIIVLVSWFIAMAHPVVTLPLINKHLVMEMMAERLQVISVMLIAFGTSQIPKLIKNKDLVVVLFLALILVSVLNYSDYFEKQKQEHWVVNAGQQELAPHFAELQKWVRENTNVNDVFITTNENGFMLNALSGRKMVSYRRAHASPYTDMNQRMMDQAIILYGENEQKTKELLQKYNVKYLLWSPDWLFLEYYFDSNGQLVGFNDPLSVPDTLKYELQLKENNVNYVKRNGYFDPAPPSDAPRYDMIVTLPKNLDVEKPYSQQFLDNFKLIKTIQYNGNDAFRIYEVK
ncbi:MAG TPA: hypothetical protein VI912_04385 [Candidatus Bilamarchaeaceae archaeon]|nr:hypothetical protein [Candidatus Bilamarchaeaceae archaeon]